jgi:hypothetical protein
VSDAEQLVETLLDDPNDPKEAAADIRIPHVDTDDFEVSGSHGTLHCDPVTGDVLSLDDTGDDEDNYRDIVRIDLPEFVQWLQRVDKIAPGAGQRQSGADILFVGFWVKDGSYEGPEEDARRDYEMGLANEQADEQ